MAAVVATQYNVVMDAEDDRAERLLNPELRNGYFETENRPQRDGGWKFAYVIANLMLVVGGVAAVCHRDKNFFLHTQPDYLADATHCSEGRSLLQLEEQISSGKSVAVIFAGSILGSLTLGFSYAYLLRKHAMAAVIVSVESMAALFLSIGAAMLMDKTDSGSDNSLSAVIVLIFGGLWLLLPVLIWSRLKMVSRLLTVAGDGLAANPSLLGVCLSMLTAGFGVLVVQTMFLVVGGMNGSVVPNTDVDEGGSPCKYEVHTWAMAYMLFTFVMMLWTSSLSEQMNVFAIAGTISQWYFAPPGSSTRGTTLRAVRYAFGPSFGSLCLSGAVLALINVARRIVERLRRKLGVCFTFIFQVLLSWMALFTKFSTIRMALTGEGFFTAAGGVKDLLLRNARDAYTVWWFPVFVLRMFSLVAGALWGFMIYGIAKVAQFEAPVTAAAVCAALGFIVLAFVSNIMLSIVDTVFICWVMDCDRKQVTRVEVHEVFAVMPLAKPGFAVQQPDGSYGYAPTSETPLQQGHTAPAGYTPVPNDVESAGHGNTTAH